MMMIGRCRMDSKNESETVPVEHLVLSQTYTLHALINVLERKGIITKDGVLEELSNLEGMVCGDNNG
jgi:hypothetical protein